MEDRAMEAFTRGLKMNDKRQINTEDFKNQAKDAFTSRLNIFPNTISEFDTYNINDKTFKEKNAWGASYSTNHSLV